MKAYCLDTSGLTTPLEQMPEDIHQTLWGRVSDLINDNRFAVTTEIYRELTHVQGPLGDCIRGCQHSLQMEVDEDDWDWRSYLGHATRMQDDHQAFISEFNSNRKRTVGLNDISIVALAMHSRSAPHQLRGTCA
jgi:hypothetical protein